MNSKTTETAINKSHSVLDTESPKKVPKLRFKEFSGEWVEKKLGELTKVYDGTHSTPKYVENGIPFYSVEHVTANQFSNTKYISEKVFIKENKRVKLEKNDILMTRIGDIGTSKLIDWDVKASFYVSLALIKKNDKFVSSFMNQSIMASSFQRELHSKTIHVAFPKKINLGEIGQCKINLPTLPEQQKIADCLSTWDESIENLKSLVEAKKLYKKGMMQKLFSQEIRFKADDGSDYPEWVEKKISDIFDVTRGYVLAVTKMSEQKTDEFQYPVYSSQTKSKGLTGYFNEYLYEDSITWTTDGANAGDVNFRKGKFYCTNVCGVLKSDKGYANECISQMLNSVTKRYVSYVGNPKLMNNTMGSIKINIPSSIAEQTKIANFLSAIDDEIELLEQELEQLQLQKKGLMQGMFV